MLLVFLFIFLLQILFFVYAAINKTDKVTDLSYGLTFVFASIFSLYLGFEYISLYKWVLATLIVAWGLRLAIYLFIRVLRIGKDKRFDGIREDLKRFGSFWLLQAVSIFVILLPTIFALLYQRETSLNAFSYVGLFISLFGLIIESIADMQKYVFKNKEENRGKWISSGLWKYSRHPNYLGEILMWVGVFIYVLPYLNDISLLTIISPIYIIYLLLFVSGVPTLEKEYAKRYEDNEEYSKYVKNTGVLLPKLF